jgi:hypothetical protein
MNQYPNISTEVAGLLFAALPGDSLPTFDVQFEGAAPLGVACQAQDFAPFLREWEAMRNQANVTRPAIEGALSCSLYDLLRKAPPQALEDVGYWRWVAALPLRELVLWHGAKTAGEPSAQAFGHAAETHAHLVESVPYRMYLRGSIATDAAALENSLKREGIAQLGGNDLWRSHILRAGTGEYPLSAAAFLIEAADKPRDVFREAAKHLNRSGAQIARWSMSYEEARAFAREAMVIGEEVIKEKVRI